MKRLLVHVCVCVSVWGGLWLCSLMSWFTFFIKLMYLLEHYRIIHTSSRSEYSKPHYPHLVSEKEWNRFVRPYIYVEGGLEFLCLKMYACLYIGPPLLCIDKVYRRMIIKMEALYPYETVVLTFSLIIAQRPTLLHDYPPPASADSGSHCPSTGRYRKAVSVGF